MGNLCFKPAPLPDTSAVEDLIQRHPWIRSITVHKSPEDPVVKRFLFIHSHETPGWCYCYDTISIDIRPMSYAEIKGFGNTGPESIPDRVWFDIRTAIERTWFSNLEDAMRLDCLKYLTIWIETESKRRSDPPLPPPPAPISPMHPLTLADYGLPEEKDNHEPNASVQQNVSSSTTV